VGSFVSAHTHTHYEYTDFEISRIRVDTHTVYCTLLATADCGLISNVDGTVALDGHSLECGPSEVILIEFWALF